MGSKIAAFAQGVASDSHSFFISPPFLYCRTGERVNNGVISSNLSFFYTKTISDHMGRRRFEKLKERRRQIAGERIDVLMSMAEERALEGDMDHASRYAHLARKIGMRYNVTMPRGFKLRFCRKCGTYLLPSKTSSVRLSGNRLTSRCASCGAVFRMPLKRKEAGD